MANNDGDFNTGSFDCPDESACVLESQCQPREEIEYTDYTAIFKERVTAHLHLSNDFLLGYRERTVLS